MESNEPNKYYRGVHRPHKQLKFPLFGGGGSSERKPRRRDDDDDGSSIDWGNDLIPKLIPLVVIAFIAYAIWDTFSNIGGPRRNIVDQPGAIQELAWDRAKVTKKYAEITTNRTRYLLELRGADGQKQLLDLRQEKSNAWDQIDVRNFLTKPAGSLQIKVNGYARDTTLTMKF
jgi:hypothetical protein